MARLLFVRVLLNFLKIGPSHYAPSPKKNTPSASKRDVSSSTSKQRLRESKTTAFNWVFSTAVVVVRTIITDRLSPVSTMTAADSPIVVGTRLPSTRPTRDGASYTSVLHYIKTVRSNSVRFN